MSDDQHGGAAPPLVDRRKKTPRPARPDPSKNPGVLFPSAKSGCDGLIGIIFGHRYEPRWDETVPGITYLPAPNNKISIGGYELFMEANRKALLTTTYRGDVCRRCGDVVNAPEKP